MARPGIPRLNHHKPSGRARVRLNGRDHYCGLWGTKEAQAEYDRIIAEWLANGRMMRGEPGVVTIKMLVDRFMDHARAYYRRDAGRTSETDNFRLACEPLLRLYATLPVDAFGPIQFKAVRQAMIDSGSLCRNTINARCKKIRSVLSWGVSEQMVSAETLAVIRTIAPLKAGRTKARESQPVKPVPEATIRATCAVLHDEARAMVEMQLLTGMRPGEMVAMTPAQIDMQADPWVYSPARHKTQHHGKPREVFLNARAQQIIRERLTIDPHAPVFRNRNGRAYTIDSYATLITRAARRANVPHWSPNQLRHNVATELRRRFGLDVASAVLGHSKPDTTLIYAEPHRQAAMQAVAALSI